MIYRWLHGHRLPLIALAAFLLSLFILGYLVYQDRAQILAYDWQFRWDHLLLSFILFQIALILAAFIWTDMMRALGSDTSVSAHVRIYCLSHLARRLPGTIWYLAGRGYFYRQQKEDMRRMAMASSLELVIFVLSGAVTALGFGTQSLAALSSTYVYSLVAVALLGSILLHPRTVQWGLLRVGLPAANLVRYPLLLRWLAGYVLIWVLGGLLFYSTARAIMPLPFEQLPFFIGIWSLVGTGSIFLFFLPSNLGFTEVGLSLLLATVLPSALAVSVTVFARLAQYAYELLAIGVLVASTLILQWRIPSRR